MLVQDTSLKSSLQSIYVHSFIITTTLSQRNIRIILWTKCKLWNTYVFITMNECKNSQIIRTMLREDTFRNCNINVMYYGLWSFQFTSVAFLNTDKKWY